MAGAITETGGAAYIGPTVVDGTEVCSPLSPVTMTRTVEPTSPEPSVYVASVEPEMSAQLAPAASQRGHGEVKAIGPVPVQAPGSAVSVWPSTGVPAAAGVLAVAGGSTATLAP